jgi:hypothetical protein
VFNELKSLLNPHVASSANLVLMFSVLCLVKGLEPAAFVAVFGPAGNVKLEARLPLASIFLLLVAKAVV